MKKKAVKPAGPHAVAAAEAAKAATAKTRALNSRAAALAALGGQHAAAVRHAVEQARAKAAIKRIGAQAEAAFLHAKTQAATPAARKHAAAERRATQAATAAAARKRLTPQTIHAYQHQQAAKAKAAKAKAAAAHAAKVTAEVKALAHITPAQSRALTHAAKVKAAQAAGRRAAAKARAKAAAAKGKKPVRKPAKRALAGYGPGAGMWLDGGNDWLPTCAVTAVANHLYAVTGAVAGLADIIALHLHAGGDLEEGGPDLAAVLEICAAAGLAGVQLAGFWPVDPADVTPGLVAGVTYPGGDHTVLTIPGGIVTWGGEAACGAGVFSEAWALDWDG